MSRGAWLLLSDEEEGHDPNVCHRSPRGAAGRHPSQTRADGYVGADSAQIKGDMSTISDVCIYTTS